MHWWIVDSADDDAVERCAAQIESEFGAPEALVNSAGIIQVPLPPAQLSMRVWEDVIRIDQRGGIILEKILAPFSAIEKRGLIEPADLPLEIAFAAKLAR